MSRSHCGFVGEYPQQEQVKGVKVPPRATPGEKCAQLQSSSYDLISHPTDAM